MDNNFKYNPANKPEPVRIEQVFAEKPAGGMIKAPAFDILPTTAVGKNADGTYSPIKAYRLVKAVGNGDTQIHIEKNSGVKAGDYIAYGKKAVGCSTVYSQYPDYDQVTLSAAMGVAIPADAVLYQAKEISENAAEPILTPLYVIGNYVEGGDGDKSVRLINGANLRKETACIGEDIAALLPAITLV